MGQGEDNDRDDMLKALSALSDRLDHIIKRQDEIEVLLQNQMGSLKSRLTNDTRSIVRTAFQQAEIARHLQELLGSDVRLPPSSGWAASPDFLLYIFESVISMKPELIVELGSGISTIVLAAAVQRNGTGRVLSLEHDERYRAMTTRALQWNKLSERIEVLSSPLVEWTPAQPTTLGTTWQWYEVPSAVWDAGTIDMLVVDGPPAASAQYARYPAVPAFRSRLADNAAIFLDDMVRDDEKAIAAEWAHNWDLELETMPEFEKGLAALRCIQK